MQKTERTFKIAGIGKGTSKTYTTFADAENAIRENGIEPPYKATHVSIVETIVKVHKVKVEIPTLSLANKQLLIDYIKNNLTCSNITGDTLSTMMYLFKYPHSTHPILNMLFKTWFLDRYKVTDAYLQSVLSKDELYNTELYKKTNGVTVNIEGYVQCIKQFLELIDANEATFVYNTTNYKPCHNILLMLPYRAGTDADMFFNMQMRTNDFPYNQGNCYGRNVTCMNTVPLHDNNLEKYCKELGIDLA